MMTAGVWQCPPSWQSEPWDRGLHINHFGTQPLFEACIHLAPQRYYTVQQISKPNPFLVLFGAVGGAWALFIQFGSIMIALTAIWVVLSSKTKVVTEIIVRKLTMSTTQGKVSPLAQQDVDVKADDPDFHEREEGSFEGAQMAPSDKQPRPQDAVPEGVPVRGAEAVETALSSQQDAPCLSAPYPRQSPTSRPRPISVAPAAVPVVVQIPPVLDSPPQISSNETIARPPEHETLSSALKGLADDLAAPAELLRSESGRAV